MKHTISFSLAISLVLTLSMWAFSVPKVMTLDLVEEQGEHYTSEVFHLPIQVSDVTLDISVLMDTYLRATLELRVGEDYVRFHLNDLSVSGHIEYNIFELFAKLTSKDIMVKLYIDTDGIVQGSPQVSITYYGLW